MAWEEISLLRTFQAGLPADGWVLLQEQTGRPWVITADIDGDGYWEIIGAYRVRDENRLRVLKYDGKHWTLLAEVSGPGYQVSSMQSAPITSQRVRNVVVGWQIGAIWSELAIYEWTKQGLRDAAPPHTSYSYMEIVRFPGDGDDGEHEGPAELALWVHDTGLAYTVDVYRYVSGKLQPDETTYPYYFPKVVRYYENLVEAYPDTPFYRHYLNDARTKAEGTGSGTVRFSREVGLYPMAVKTLDGTKWGYIDSRGRIAIVPQYDHANDFQDNGLAIVDVQGRSGIIDSAGRYRVQPVYDSISPFSEGRSVVIDGQGFKVIDEQGRVLTPKAYSFIGTYREGRAYASTADESGGKYGYIDLQGKEIIPPQYAEAGDFHQGKAVVKVKEVEFALIGLEGQILHIYRYPYVGSLRDGLLPFQQEAGGKYGYLDEEGNVAIAPVFTGAMPFQDGRAVINISPDVSNKYGMIDTKGHLVLNAEYNEVRQLGDGRVAVGFPIREDQPFIGSIYAIADYRGQFLTGAIYDGVGNYTDGLASAYDKWNTYFIDDTGKPASGLPKIAGSGTLKFAGPLIQANVDQRILYVDRSGRVIWQPNRIIPLAPPYQVIEYKYKPNKDYLVYYPQLKGMGYEEAQRKANEKLKELSQVKPVGEGQLEYSYTGDFNIAFYRYRLVVFELNGYNYPFGAAHGMPYKVYAHVDLTTGRLYGLKDLFKPDSDYVTRLSAIIGEQIKSDPKYDYVFPDSYKGIAADQPFYVSGDALYIYFNPYDIAPYAAGFPTFRISYKEIMDIIATHGAFWTSFHRLNFM